MMVTYEIRVETRAYIRDQNRSIRNVSRTKQQKATAQSSSHIHVIYYNYEYLLQQSQRSMHVYSMRLCVCVCVQALCCRFVCGDDVEWYILFDCYITYSLVSQPHSVVRCIFFIYRVSSFIFGFIFQLVCVYIFSSSFYYMFRILSSFFYSYNRGYGQ